MPAVNLEVQRNGTKLPLRCSFSASAAFRMKGLLGRAELSRDDSILIKPCQQIHMFFMKFAIDAVFLNADGNVSRIYHDIKPWKVSGYHPRANAVWEMASGAAEYYQIEPGSSISFLKPSGERL